MAKFYLTTTLPYVNAEPHIGFALEIIEADALARYHRLRGDDVFFNTGTDEHGAKVFRKAQELGMEPRAYCDEKALIFEQLKDILNLSYDNFIRTTDDYHIKAAQAFWQKCEINGDIYKKNYKIKYCVGCELEKTDSELISGHCPLHPGLELEIIEEENYFFRFSNYQEKLLKLYEENPQFVLPETRFNEIKKFVEMGLEDFSVSRLKSKMPWGIEVPGDSQQVMYVWFDALVNYISAIGWPDDSVRFNEWWPVVQLAGKDNLRQQAAMWQAMLMSVGLLPSRQIFINGFINVGGQKMSKSLGNVISPQEMVEKFGVDATRYLILSLGPFGEDTDAIWDKFKEKYNADLANGLGNLISRVFNIIELNYEGKIQPDKNSPKDLSLVDKQMEILNFHHALIEIMNAVQWANQHIEQTKLWELAKNDKALGQKVVGELVALILAVAEKLQPIMPQTSQKIIDVLQSGRIVKGEPLFMRLK